MAPTLRAASQGRDVGELSFCAGSRRLPAIDGADLLISEGSKLGPRSLEQHPPLSITHVDDPSAIGIASLVDDEDGVTASELLPEAQKS
jgi:hypothetical protein